MESYLKKYKFVFNTVGPVFIGSGQNLKKKEYIFDEKKGRVKIIDVNKMLGFICKDKNLMRDYEKLMMSGDKNDDLQSFFNDHKISEKDYKNWILRECNVKGNFNGEDINTFVRDGRGEAYIPGSSLKGMFRTVILSYLIRHADEEYKNEMRARVAEDFSDEHLDEVDKAMSVKFLHSKLTDSDRKDMVNSIMRGLIISDSKKIADKNMALYKKFDMSVKGEGHSLNLVRECVDFKVKIETTITIDTTIFPYTKDELFKMFEEFTQYYKEILEDKFKGCPKHSVSNKRFFLGGGAGFISKTDLYALFDEKKAIEITGRILDSKFQNKEHLSDAKVHGISPRILKCVEIKGNKPTNVSRGRMTQSRNSERYQMGECEVVSMVEI
ncbi:type III-A CRISPR-associated RAMP protein Csm5 [Lachnospiraceae bacterium oral taxon 096]|nr:type III-A CRISPR-associated RAMP protein Csm5 [Lachnospiraceae bacterium oral taxon 096]QUI95525.1 type III-A CRISPR-associated RAMP protein Csm5 [Lachnospiraceae bacterium oral taxon 096]